MYGPSPNNSGSILNAPIAGDNVTVIGTFYSLTTGGVPTSPFPHLKLALNGQVIATFTAEVTNGTLAMLSYSQFAPGRKPPFLRKNVSKPLKAPIR